MNTSIWTAGTNFVWLPGCRLPAPLAHIGRMMDSKTNAAANDRMNHMYDGFLANGYYERYYEGSGYFNFGYWEPRANSQPEACDALVDVLVGQVGKPGGRILAVACGPGGSTHRLLSHNYRPRDITAINISDKQLAAAEARVPGCQFLKMDATQLEFPNAYFDTVLCVEAAVNFNTRQRFFEEAWRVLKPGGSLVLSDMLFRKVMRPFAAHLHVPPDNFVRDLAAYSAALADAGFRGVRVKDATEVCLAAFREQIQRWPEAEYRCGRMSLRQRLLAHAFTKAIAAYLKIACHTYIIASARKPGEACSSKKSLRFDSA